MFRKSFSSSIAEVLQADRQEEVGSGAHDRCPVCEHAGAREWLRAPDRFHGRQQNYTLLRCPVCSLVWLRDPPLAGEMHNHYTSDYHRLISAAGETSPSRWQGRMETLTQFKRAGAILDLGCSSGSFLTSLKGESWERHGIEIAADCAKIAQARSGAQVFVGDVLDAPFPPGSFDVITCFDVLEHLYEPRLVMAKVREWLKPGGVFYFLVPNVDSSEARVFESYWAGLELPRHLFHYSPSSLRYLAKSVGLKELSLVTRRNPSVGTSMRYFCDDILLALGVSRIPAAHLRAPGIPWRVARKLVRLTILRLLMMLAPLAGGGESIHAIFEKEIPHPGIEPGALIDTGVESH
jgi:2-polyprenyl-3-methyl-5-hydroxy-6-metoxy-1,4-benzoquinol methylase